MSIDSKRVKEIFLTAAELPDQTAQIAYLEQACGEDSGLRERVEALLRSHDPASSFLGTPAAAIDSEVAEQTVDSASPVSTSRPGNEDEDEALGFLSPPTRPDSLGRIGHYEALQLLGKGGFGIVLRAFDDILQRVVAIKVMAPQLAATSPARKRFLREARSSAQVRHENVVQVYEVAEQPLPHLVMEFIPGETLQQRLDRKGPLEVQEILSIGRQIAEGLAAAHATDLIHRDIKPGNVLLEGGNQRVKITDFGLARAADDASMTQSGTIAGTPMYMAPEQASGQTLDQRADLFSLGSVLYQMASGRAPFRANTTIAVLKRVAEDKPRNIREIIPETPQWLCDIISKLHAKDPNDRYQSAREVADVLANCEAQLKEYSKLQDLSLIPQNMATTKISGSRNWAAGAILFVFLMAGVYFAKPLFFLDPAESAIPLSKGPKHEFLASRAESLPPTFTNSLGMEFVIVPKGKSWLGGGNEKLGDKEVKILADFYMGKYEVTQEEWEQVMGENPSYFSRTGEGKDAVKDIPDADLKLFPVERVSWDRCQVFVAKLNQREKETGWVYRLPMEKEWEYACRGGPMADKADSAFDFYFAKPTNTLTSEQANFGKDLGLNRTCKVGSYEANRLGLFDLHGNVWEWCDDVKDVDGQALRTMSRGGGWDYGANICRASTPQTGLPSYSSAHQGLRLARVPSDAPSPEAKTPPLAVAPFDATQAKQHQEAWAKHLGVPIEYTNGIGIKFRLIPPGEFVMGASEGEVKSALVGEPPGWLVDRVNAEGPQRRTTVPAPFYLGQLEVTLGQFRQFVRETGYRTTAETNGKGGTRLIQRGSNVSSENVWSSPTDSPTEDYPVVFISIEDARQFCTWLGKKDGRTYALPRDDQWEFACRAGTTTPWFSGNDQADVLRVAWVAENSEQRLHPGGRKDANAFGLHDMLGNVEEICEAIPPQVPTRRGGGAQLNIDACRSASRGAWKGDTFPWYRGGFRVAIIDLKPATTSLPRAAVAQFIDADVRRIAALPANEQVEEVRKELKKRNPDFDGSLTPTIEDDVVTGLEFLSTHVSDLSPVRGLSRLTTLNCRGNGPGGMISDLKPLQGMQLEKLTLSVNPVSDLSPLKGMSLTELHIDNSLVDDLSPLTGMPLKVLNCSYTKAANLAPLKKSPLLILWSNNTEIADLSPLKEKPLEWITIHETRVTDISVLKGMPLSQIYLDYVPARDRDILRSLPNLQKANDLPLAEFWQKFEAKPNE